MTIKPDAATQLTLPSDREIVITRVFNAPPRKVFTAFTTPEHVKHWFGPQRFTLSTCEIDLRVGGRWRYVLRDEDGSEYGFGGEYREIAPPERWAFTEGFEGAPGHEALITVTLEARDGGTLYTSHSLYASAEDRDAHIASGMEPGMRETLERFAAHLETMA